MRVKTYLSFFFLFLFLFPQAEKAIHNISHADDFHCTVKSGAHLHELSHTCDLCDYNSGNTTPCVDESLGYFTPNFSKTVFIYSESVPFDSEKYLFLLRAPPVVS
jgi:hypothetical protein